MPAASPAMSAERLTEFAVALLTAAGMDDDKAATVARLMVLTDMMGRRTHGLAMLPLYLGDIRKGGMRVTGRPTVIKDSGATILWDGDYLPGLWLVNEAIDIAMPRAAELGVVTVVIRKSHHIGCLAALVKQAADKGFVAIIANSDPSAKRVAPFGGTEQLFSPNPFAVGYPLADHPVLIDICASITTVSMARQKFAAGELFDLPWLLDEHGVPTRDPSVLENKQPPGTLQLMGGQDYGHKGFGLALMIEALSQGLSGHGRRDEPKRWGGNVFLQIIDPDFFAGRDAFVEQTQYLAERSRANRPVRADRPVRLPGDQAAQSIEVARTQGITYDAIAWTSLTGWATDLFVALPRALPA